MLHATNDLDYHAWNPTTRMTDDTEDRTTQCRKDVCTTHEHYVTMPVNCGN